MFIVKTVRTECKYDISTDFEWKQKFKSNNLNYKFILNKVFDEEHSLD